MNKEKSLSIMNTSSAEYFKSCVGDAIEHQNLEVSDFLEFYIVNLLVEKVKFKANHCNLENGTEEEPLSMVLCQAMQAEYYSEKVKLFKSLGDCTLFIAGFFSDSLHRKLVDVDYYKSIGGTAYLNLAALMRGKSHGKVFSELFTDLSDRFQYLVDILAEVSDTCFSQSDLGVLRIYERWMKTGSERDAALLRDKGIIPVQGDTMFIQ